MAVSFETGYKKMANVLAAILFYHPAKNVQVPANGEGWDPYSSEKHPRLAGVEIDDMVDFEEYTKNYQVPVQKPVEGKSTIIGLVNGEQLIDGYAGPLKFCNWYICLCCLGTLSVHTIEQAVLHSPSCGHLLLLPSQSKLALVRDHSSHDYFCSSTGPVLQQSRQELCRVLRSQPGASCSVEQAE